MTHRNAPAQGTPDASIPSQYSRAYPVLSGPDVHHYGEPVALVVADDLRAGARGGESRRRRLRRRAGTVRLRRAPGPGVRAEDGERRAADRQRGGRLRRRVRRRRGQGRSALHDAVSVLPADGAARVPGGAERRGPDRLRQRADRRRGAHLDRQHAPDRPAADPHRHPVRRRRVRLQARHPLRDDPGGARRPRAEPAGQGRA